MTQPNADPELLPTEHKVASVHRHWLVLFRVTHPIAAILLFIIPLALVLAGDLLQRVAGILLLLAALTLRIWVWWQDEVVLTDRRVLRRSGVFTIEKDYISLGRVTDVTTVKPLLGRIFDYGNISIESASSHPALSNLTFLASPDDFFDELRLRVYGREGDFPPGQFPPSSTLPPPTATDTSPVPFIDAPASDTD